MPNGFPPQTLERARHRFNLATRAYYALKSAATSNDFQAAWSDFLTHAGGVLHNLEGGCSKSPQLRQWYGGVRRLARKEQFFRYLYQARNAEEHNREFTYGLQISGGAHIDGGGGTFRHHGPGPAIRIGPDGVILAPGLMTAVDGRKMKVCGGEIRPRLLAIKDEKHGDVYEVPECVGGIRLNPADPGQFAGLYLNYLHGLLLDLRPDPGPQGA